jgi:alpha-tubulin suppressor-like RCC1 family protein
MSYNRFHSYLLVLLVILAIAIMHVIEARNSTSAYSFGNGVNLNLGNGLTTKELVPFRINNRTDANGQLPNGKYIIAVSAGGGHSLIIDEDNNAYSFGNGLSGALGNGKRTDEPIPYRINKQSETNGDLPAGKKIIVIAAGGGHSLIIDEDYNAYSFGSGANGRLANGKTENGLPSYEMKPFRINKQSVANGDLPAGKKIIAVAAGGGHSLIIDEDNNAYSFGDGDKGKLGNNLSSGDVAVPFRINTQSIANGDLPAGKKVIAVSAGSAHSLIIDEDYNAYSFGDGSNYALANGKSSSEIVPFKINKEIEDNGGLLQGNKITAISAGFSHSLIIDGNENAYSFGIGSDYRLGNGKTSSELKPFKINSNSANGDLPAGKKVIAISAGGSASLIIDEDYNAYSFGTAINGIAGNGQTTGSQQTPFRINKISDANGKLPAGRKVISISAGTSYSLIIDSAMACFGEEWDSSYACSGMLFSHCNMCAYMFIRSWSMYINRFLCMQ